MTFVGALVGPALAAPTVEVRARAALEDLAADCTGARCAVSGRLRDDLGRGVAGAMVTLDAPEQRVRSDAEGRFRVVLDALPDGEHRWRLRFGGSRLLGAAEASLTGRAGRHPVKLTATLPTPAEAGRPLPLRVRAESASALNAATFLTWRLDNGAPAPLALDLNEAAQTLLPGQLPGRHTLEVTYPGDGQHLPATLTQVVAVVQPILVTLAARWHPQGPTISGRISPVDAPAPVLLTLDGAAFQRAQSGADGTFAVRLGPQQLAPGTYSLRALVAGDDALGRASGASESVVLVVPTPPPSPPPSRQWWLLAPVALTLLGLGGLVRRRRNPTPRPAPAPRQAPPAPVQVLAPPAPGPRLVQLVSATTGAALTGLIAPCTAAVDDPFAPPADAATVPATGASVPPKTAFVWAEAPGHGPVCVALPPGARVAVQLWPLAAVAQHAFEACLRRAGVPVLQFGRETPHQAGVALQQRGGGSAAEQLAAAIARACFGPEAPTRAEARDLVERCAGLWVTPSAPTTPHDRPSTFA